MMKRFVVIWFRYLQADWLIRQRPELANTPFVYTVQDHGRLLISAVSRRAAEKGISTGMLLPDANLVLPGIIHFSDAAGLNKKILRKLCLWCIRFTPVATTGADSCIILDATGCTHLWGGEENYISTITSKLQALGYCTRAALAGTIGLAWAMAYFGEHATVIPAGKEYQALLQLPPAALRIDSSITERLHKLGLNTIGSFIQMPCSALRRRFGPQLLQRLSQALGKQEEYIVPLQPAEPYLERIPFPEPVQTVYGIEEAISTLLASLCKRLYNDGKGCRQAVFKAYRVDNNIQEISISTSHASTNEKHLFKLFRLKICTLEPDLGFELCTLEAVKTEDLKAVQETLWTGNNSLESTGLAELLDNIQSKYPHARIQRFLPAEHHMPERSYQLAESLHQKPVFEWATSKPRPIQLLGQPVLLKVTAPVPDYPPMNFRYNNQLHIVQKADGPERIEAEWWLNPGLHRDYYMVEDEQGKRFWIFRLGHYNDTSPPQWYLHGFFP